MFLLCIHDVAKILLMVLYGFKFVLVLLFKYNLNIYVSAGVFVVLYVYYGVCC